MPTTPMKAPAGRGFRLFCGLTALTVVPPAQAHFNGRVDSEMAVAHRRTVTRPRVRQQVEMRQEDDRKRNRLDVAYTLNSEREPDHPLILKLSWTHAPSRWPLHVTVGRFDRADASGYYGLDGVQVQYGQKDQRIFFHGGRTLHLEEGASDRGERQVGLEIRGPIRGWPLPPDETMTLDYTLGGHYRWRATESQRLYGSGHLVAGEGNTDLSARVGLNPETGRLIDLSAEARHTLSPWTRLRLGYRQWRQPIEATTFRERFLAVFNRDGHSRLRGTVETEINRHWRMRSSLSRIHRPGGTDGLIAEVGVKHTDGHAIRWRGDVHLSSTDRESLASLMVSRRQSVNAHLLADTTLALGLEDTLLATTERRAGAGLRLRYRLNAWQFLDSHGELVVHDNRSRDYRLGLRHTWMFDGFWSERQR